MSYRDEGMTIILAEIERAAAGAGLSDNEAAAISQLVDCRVREKLGGDTVWVAKMNKAARNQLIRAEWNGNNLGHIMDKYSIHRSTFYRIIGQAC